MKLSESQALARSAAYCSKAERCRSDVKKKLVAWELEQELITRILEHLEKEKFIDDVRFCDSFIRDKMRFNKWGKVKIVFELKKRHIASSIIEQAIENLVQDDFEAILLKALQTKNKSIKAENDYQRRTKLIRFALGRGYTMDQVLRCVNKLVENTDEDNFF